MELELIVAATAPYPKHVFRPNSPPDPPQRLHWKTWCRLISSIGDPGKFHTSAKWRPISINIIWTSMGRGLLMTKPTQYLFWSTCCKPISAIRVPNQLHTNAEWRQSSSILYGHQWLKALWPNRLNTYIATFGARSPAASTPARHRSQSPLISYGYQ